MGIAIASVLLIGCPSGGNDDAEGASAASGEAGATSATEADTGSGPTTADATSNGDGTTTGDSGVDGGPIFDLGAQPDIGGMDVPVIPQTCAQAEVAETTVGCLFFAVDLDQAGGLGSGTETDQYAVGVSNVQTSQTAHVTIEHKVGGVWMIVEGPIDIEPRDLYAFELPDLHQETSGLLEAGAYRITSDVPVIAYQFNPLVAAAASSDASMLYPVSSWDTIGHVVQWATGAGRPYVTIAAGYDGTMVEVMPTVATQAGPGVAAGGPNTPIAIALDEGDVAEVMVATNGQDITGTVVTSNEGHPVAVFSGHECANIPDAVVACDHIEDQLSGLRLWGTSFVASRVVPRQPTNPETSAWHIYASEDDTQVDITAAVGVTGLPATPVMLDGGERLEFFAAGPADRPGDFIVETSKPAALVNYMTGWGNLAGSNQGDPAMVQLAPTAQFLPRYVVLVPSQWVEDYLVVTRPAGATITLDDAEIPDADFIDVGAGYEVARVQVEDGVHALDGTAPFGVVVVGYDFANSYAYLGGASTGKINPDPAG